MTNLAPLNRDALDIAPQDVSRGERLGFLGALEASYDATVRASSQFGLEQSFREEERANNERIRARGGKPQLLDDQAPEPLLGRPQTSVSAFPEPADGFDAAGATAPVQPSTSQPSNLYGELAKALASGNQEQVTSLLGKRNDELRKMQAQHPDAGIQTYDDMFATVRKKAEEAERRTSQPFTFGGYIGSFAGGAAAGVNPRVNPLNFMTLPAGGAGRGVIGRIATQAGVQGAVEAVNQVTGVQQNRELLGLSHGFGDAARNVAFAAAGGAAIQGLGEAAGAGLKWAGRKWFRDVPGDPAPAPPVPPTEVIPEAARAFETRPVDTARIPLETQRAIAQAVNDTIYERAPFATSRMGMARAETDLAHVTTQLEGWGGPEPWRIPPTTDTRLPGAVNTDVAPRIEPRSRGETVDEVARRVDPQAFNTWDKMTARRDELRALIADADKVVNDVKTGGAIAETQAQVDALRERLSTTRNAKQRQRIETEIEALSTAAQPEIGGVDIRASREAHRAELMQLDEQMRDHAPVVARAMRRAEGKWDVYEKQRGDIAKSLDEHAATVTPWERDIGEMPDLTEVTITDRVPELAGTRTVEGVKPGEPAVEALTRINAQVAKDITDAVEAYQKSLPQLLAKEGDSITSEIKVAGTDLTLHLDNDKVTVPNPDGSGKREISIRQLLEEADEDRATLQAVSSCSINSPS